MKVQGTNYQIPLNILKYESYKQVQVLGVLNPIPFESKVTQFIRKYSHFGSKCVSLALQTAHRCTNTASQFLIWAMTSSTAPPSFDNTLPGYHYFF